MRGVGRTIGIAHELAVAMICRDQQLTTQSQGLLHHLSHPVINGFHRLDGCLDNPDVPHHVRVRIVENDEVIHVDVGIDVEAVDPQPEVRIDPPEDPILVEKVFQPKEHFVGTKGDMVRMSKGFHFDYAFETSKGDSASVERKNKKSYVAEYRLKVPMPKASTSLKDLSSVNSHLPKLLPGLELMLEGAVVSDFYYTLYENKVKRLEREVLKLNELSTKHNFYDCETILNLTSQKTGRKVLLLQGDMDVVSDGSDGDRLAKMPDKIVNSTHYQQCYKNTMSIVQN